VTSGSFGRRHGLEWQPPNGSRLSCGRHARGRPGARPADGVGRRTNGILPYWAAPASSKRLLGGGCSMSVPLTRAAKEKVGCDIGEEQERKRER
jgi:hypothetical protein